MTLRCVSLEVVSVSLERDTCVGTYVSLMLLARVSDCSRICAGDRVESRPSVLSVVLVSVDSVRFLLFSSIVSMATVESSL